MPMSLMVGVGILQTKLSFYSGLARGLNRSKLMQD
jgi:hypothetical protein